MIFLMKSTLQSFKILIFDSDGVVLNSNSIKLNAFYDLAKTVCCKQCALEIKSMILKSKNMTRYDIIKAMRDMSIRHHGLDLYSFESLLSRYSSLVSNSLVECDVDPGIYSLRRSLRSSKWLILTAGDQEETQSVYKKKGLYKMFDAGIYGSPRTKMENLRAILDIHGSYCAHDILMLGDSYTDAELAFENGIKYAHIRHWSHCHKAHEYCNAKTMAVFKDIADLASKGWVS